MTTRVLTLSEQQCLSGDQKAYLMKYRNIVSLEPHVPASQALYLTLRHGAVTIARAMELDALHDSYLLHQAQEAKQALPYDSYSAAESRFIDLHGMSSQLD